MTDLAKIFGKDLAKSLALNLAGPASAPVDPNIYYVNDFQSGNHYDTASPGGEAGTSSGYISVYLIAIESQVGSASRVIGGRVGSGPTAGHNIITTGTNSALATGQVSGAGSFTSGPGMTLPAGAVLKWLHVAFGLVGGQQVLWVNGATQGLLNNSPLTGFTAAAVATIIGRRYDGLPATNVRFAGLFQAQGSVTGSAIAKHYADCVAAADIADSMTGMTPTHSYSVKRNQSGSAPATITDRVGTDNMTKVGTPAFGTDAAAAWYSPSGAIDLVIGNGDSEMEGAATSVGAPVGYPPTDRTLWMVRNELSIRELAEPCGQGFPTTGWGPGGMYVFKKQVSTGRQPIFVNAGWGGLRTDQMLPGSAYYTRLLGKVTMAAKMPNVTLRCILDFSGANNALQGTNTWTADMTTILAQLRIDCAALFGSYATTVPFLYTRLRSTITGSSTLANVRADQLAFTGVAANTIMLQQQDAWAMNADGIHMLADGNDSWATAAALLV